MNKLKNQDPPMDLINKHVKALKEEMSLEDRLNRLAKVGVDRVSVENEAGLLSSKKVVN